MAIKQAERTVSIDTTRTIMRVFRSTRRVEVILLPPAGVQAPPVRQVLQYDALSAQEAQQVAEAVAAGVWPAPLVEMGGALKSAWAAVFDATISEVAENAGLADEG